MVDFVGCRWDTGWAAEGWVRLNSPLLMETLKESTFAMLCGKQLIPLKIIKSFKK